MSNIMKMVSNAIWTPLYFLLFGLGIYFTLKTNFFQVRKFKFMLKKTVGMIFDKQQSTDKGAFTPWQAVATSLGSTVGTGNIVGVSTAIVVGGPGAIFWMWIISFFGMMLKYSEIVLALKFREKNENGEWCGGPMYYIKNGLKLPLLASLFSILLVIAALTAGNIVQINSIALILEDYISVPSLLTGVIVAFIIALVVIGGMQSIGKVTEKLVPIMSIMYIAGSIFVFIVNIKYIPGVFASIFQEAFKLKSIGGGALGYGIFTAMHYGIARGTASSEAGLGSAPIAQAASNLKEPVEQALYGILEVFVSSMIICTSTALVILTGRIYDKNVYGNAILNFGLNGLKNLDHGVVLTAKSFASAMGLPIARLFVTLCIIFFALSTIIGYFYYGLKAIEFLFAKKSAGIYKFIFLAAIVIGSVIDINLVWELSDISDGLMAIPNLIALIFLSPIVLTETKKYFDKQSQ